MPHIKLAPMSKGGEGICVATGEHLDPCKGPGEGAHSGRSAGFTRQAGEPHWGCRMNPACRSAEPGAVYRAASRPLPWKLFVT